MGKTSELLGPDRGGNLWSSQLDFSRMKPVPYDQAGVRENQGISIFGFCLISGGLAEEGNL